MMGNVSYTDSISNNYASGICFPLEQGAFKNERSLLPEPQIKKPGYELK